jgi:ABC-type transport system substrate-binding protein
MASADRFYPVWGVFAVALALSGCSRHTAATATFTPGRPLVSDVHPVQGDWVVQRIGSDIDSLNPVILESADGQAISSEINEGLLQLNNYTLKLEPCLAESTHLHVSSSPRREVA